MGLNAIKWVNGGRKKKGYRLKWKNKKYRMKMEKRI